MKLWIYLLILVFSNMADAVTADPRAVRYRYVLEESFHDVCQHMTQVFNQRFKTPWNKGFLESDPAQKIFGTRFDQVFERFPGVEYNMRATWTMLLAKYPTSPEYDAVKWRETRVGPESERGKNVYPALVAQLDIDNDGELDWVIKDTFMDKLTTFEGWGQAHGFSEDLSIFPRNGFEPSVPIPRSTFAPHHNPALAPRKLGSNLSAGMETYQLRPFIFRNKTYVSAYQAYWPNLAASELEGRYVRLDPPKEFPDREYMNIFDVQPGSFVKDGAYKLDIRANTEKLCRIRMRMQNRDKSPR